MDDDKENRPANSDEQFMQEKADKSKEEISKFVRILFSRTKKSEICFICKKDTDELARCGVLNCDKFYHFNCLKNSIYLFEIEETRAHYRQTDQSKKQKISKSIKMIKKCPQHICLTCHNACRDHCCVNEFIHCDLCPLVYHHIKSCLPADSELKNFDCFICPNHKKWIPKTNCKAQVDWQKDDLQKNQTFDECEQKTYNLNEERDIEGVCRCGENEQSSNRYCQYKPCENVSVSVECSDAICSAGLKCKNRRFTNRDYVKIELFKSKIGVGVRALEKIEQNRLVIEYVGELIDNRKRDRRLKLMKQYDDENHYFIQMEANLIADAGPKGNFARFVNHSCKPNCESDVYIVDNKARIGIFSLREITRGEEICMRDDLDTEFNFQC